MDSRRFSSLFGGSGSDSSSGSEPVDGGGSERSDLGPDADPEDLLDSLEYSVTGERYDIEALDHVREAGKLTKTVVPAPEDSPDETDVVAGPAIRKVIEKNYLEPQRPLAIGYSDSHGELKATGINLSDAFKHTWITGATGSAKSTVSRAWMTTLAYAGYGFFAGFPKGSEDAKALIRALPSHRLKDVRIIDPTETAHTIPQNLLDVPEFDDPTERDQEISERVNVLKAVLMQDYGSGFINVETVIEVSGRAMMASERDYSLVDMYFVLLSEDRRERFVEEVDDPLLADALGEVSDMDDDEIRPVIKRLMQWVLDPTIRRIVSHRESSLDWQEVIDDDLIVLLMLGVNNESVKRLLTLISWRQLTAAIQRRYNETGRQIPYFAFLDEFDAVASDKLNLQSNLARARAMGLGIFVICQYPSQLPATDENNVQKALKNNARNVVALSAEDEDDAAIMASKLRGIDAGDIVHLPDYRCWTDVPIGEGERSDALQLKTIPPMPPLRTEAEAEQVIADILEEHGVPPPTMREMIDDLPFADISADELLGATTDGDDQGADSPALVRAMALQAIYDAGFYSEGGDFVTLDEASDRITRYLDRVDVSAETPSQIEGILGQLPETLLERDRDDSELLIRCTDDGKARFLSPVDEDDQDDGKINENTGGFEHAEIMRAAYDDLLTVGLPLHVVRQGGDDAPDAIAEPESSALRSARENPTLEPVEVASLVEKFREENELLDRLTNAGIVDVEAEHSTGDTAPGVTLEHIARSIENGRRCLLLAWPDTAEAIARRLDEYPECMRTFSGEDGAHRLYNGNGDVRAGPDEVKVYRRGDGQNKWLSYEATGEVELRANGETIATFADQEDVFADPTAYPATEKDISDFSKWTAIKRPALPGRIDRSMADVIAVTGDGLRVLEDGEETPIDELGETTDQRQGGPPELDF